MPIARFSCRLDQVLEQVDLVVRMHALQHGGDTFQAHAGIDRGFGQRMHDARFVAVVLHEDVVPDFDEAVAVLIRAAGRAAGNMCAVVVENFGTGAAGAGVAHHPEIVGGVAHALVVADAHHFFRRHADFPGPDVVGFVILGVDRNHQFFLRNLEDLGQQLPGVVNRFAFEVVAEAEIAEHLEEGVVACGVADIFQIIVFAAGTHALLAGGGAGVRALVETEKDVLELVHACVGKEQGRVAGRHERARCDHLMALGGEKIQESLADFLATRSVAGFNRHCLASINQYLRRHSALF